MSGQRGTRVVMAFAVVSTVAAVLADNPVLAALALSAAAASLAANRLDGDAGVVVTGPRPTIPPRPSIPPIHPETMAFHGFEGDDALLHDVSPDETEEDDGRTDDEHLVDDLTADLGSDDEISFLRPYASDDGPRGDHDESDDLSVIWEPPPDNSLLALLNDVLEPSSKVPMPRRFALGTVALLRNLLQPADVERVLTEQKRYPRLRFGDIAIQLGLLSESELKELLEAQEEGVFTDEEIMDTRARLQAYHVESERRESA